MAGAEHTMQAAPLLAKRSGLLTRSLWAAGCMASQAGVRLQQHRLLHWH